MIREIDIGGRKVGDRNKVYLVAEIGSNHERDKKVVKELINITAQSGFDAVKFQTYEPLEVFSSKITTTELGMDKWYGKHPWWEVARDHILMPREWFGEMFAYARNKNLQVFSTIHSISDAEFIMQFDPPVFKVASIDVSNTGFLFKLASFGIPVIISTGMHYLDEIESAVNIFKNSGNDQLALLHCVSNYPPDPRDLNLKNITMLKDKFHLPVGYSDHHPENIIAGAAVGLGACIVEKHITLDKNSRGPDHSFALDSEGMRDLVKVVRSVEQSLGSLERKMSENELKTRSVSRRSFVARSNIAKGEELTPGNIKLVRPGKGIHPKYESTLTGSRAKINIEKDEVIYWEMVEKGSE